MVQLEHLHIWYFYHIMFCKTNENLLNIQGIFNDNGNTAINNELFHKAFQYAFTFPSQPAHCSGVCLVHLNVVVTCSMPIDWRWHWSQVRPKVLLSILRGDSNLAYLHIQDGHQNGQIIQTVCFHVCSLQFVLYGSLIFIWIVSLQEV